MQARTDLQRFWRNEQAQDLVEYTLLLAFLCLASAALYMSISQTINGIWTAISSRLAS
jgi:Flp pilus assembly pilin Flp